MPQINTYLQFSGNCHEAMIFYNSCLDGELELQTIGESPMADKFPVEMKDCILHATLRNGKLVLMASDLSPQPLLKGNAQSLMLDCDSEEEIYDLFEKLSEGGHQEHALEQTFWGATFGGLTDKYGHHWLLNFNKNTSK